MRARQLNEGMRRSSAVSWCSGAVIFLWSSYCLLVGGNTISVGVLHSSYENWQQMLQEYGVLHSSYANWQQMIQEHGHLNGSSLLETTVINETRLNSMQDIDTALSTVKRANIVALVGDYDELFAAVTNYLRLPYFITSIVPPDKPPSPFHAQMIPDARTYTTAIRDLFQHYQWKSAGVLFDTHVGSTVAALMMEHIAGYRDLYDVRAYDVQRNASADVVRWALKDLRKKLINNFLIICSPATADIVLTQALYLSLLSRPNSWLVVNMGSEDIELYKYIDSKANMTLIRLMVDPFSPECALNESEISLTNAIYYDVFRIINGTSLDYTAAASDKDKISRSDIRKQVKMIDINGCTGNLNFTRAGTRRPTYLQMLALEGLVNGAGFNALWETKSQSEDYKPWLLKLSGTWRSDRTLVEQRVQPSRTYSSMLSESDDVFVDKVLRVTVTIEPPFVNWRNKSEKEGLTMGNDKFEGFCIDILQEIAARLKFKYNISRVPDGKFGSLKPPPRFWTGMVRQLVDDNADIALAPFSITPERSSVVDFTKPFMTKGTSVVVKKPERSVWPFQFLSPLSKVVWIAIFFSFVFVGLFLFGVTRVSSDAHTDCKADFRESFWYVWGTLLRADLSGSPIATSGRIVSATWWFFSLIIISIYTANLAAFLTISNAHIPISSAADLSDQDEYNYGTVDGSQIESFFAHTTIAHYQKMHAFMTIVSPDSKVQRVEDGFKRVKEEKYAFIWDSPTARHETAHNCDLMEIGSPFDLKGYGIATQKYSKYSEPLSMAVLQLDDEGILYRLEGKWWRRPNCPDPRSNAKSKEIEIEVASGMFIVLFAGVTLSALVSLIQYFIRHKCKQLVFNPSVATIPYMGSLHTVQNHIRGLPRNPLILRWLVDSREPEAQTNHNHVTTTLEDHIDETTVVLSRTLSISENCVPSNRWENKHHNSANAASHS